MGNNIKINDALKISKERGFPKDLSRFHHLKYLSSSLTYLDKEFEFWNNDERLYNLPQTRVFLDEKVDGKWLYWGNALIISQTINKDITPGIYKITKIYQPDFQKAITIEESPLCKGFFSEPSRCFCSKPN